MKPLVKTFFDQGTSTFSYIVHSGKESSCAIIDPVQNFNSNNARTDYLMADEIIAFIKENNLKKLYKNDTDLLNYILFTKESKDFYTKPSVISMNDLIELQEGFGLYMSD